MLRAFKGICSVTALSGLTDEERNDIMEEVIPLADEQDRGIHEGLVFAFEMHGQEWKTVVDIGQRWVKIMTKDQFDQGMRDGLSTN